jgi:predicted adenine nucleotide alpha hydrolase (AANH) superfamily ATPase
VNNGEILGYLTKLDANISDIMERQVEKWKSVDREYLVAVAVGDFRKAQGLENMFRLCAREVVYEGMVYV